MYSDRDGSSSTTPASQPVEDIPVVGIGASAGGLAAFKALLRDLPPDTGMAFVLIQHLAPNHPSLLVELLAKDCPMPIQLASDGLPLAPNQVYAIAPGQRLSLLHNRLFVLPEDGEQERAYNLVDLFFTSLAEDRGSKAIGVVLSGTASDGSFGCRAIKEAGGITFAQDRESAEYDAMPANAVAAGCIDLVMPPAEIARELGRLARHPLLRPDQIAQPAEAGIAASPTELNKIFILLRARSGHDFSAYKETTIRRRLERRILLHKLDSTARYIQLLQHDAGEIDALFHDILINVTGFFRDPDAFEALHRIVFPALLTGRSSSLPLRIWVPGCSTGQEVYSIAIALDEYLGEVAESAPVPDIQIFGSDVDDEAIDTARTGIYPPSIANEVSAERLKRYFQRVAKGYQVCQSIRDRCIFALQDLTRDPPFSRIDLLSCRNLLIYLQSRLQQKVLQLFHYALQPEGFLLLGSSETVGDQVALFAMQDKTAKLYRKKSVATRPLSTLVQQIKPQLDEPARVHQPGPKSRVYDLDRETERRLLERYAPVGVVIDPDQYILRFLGRTWPYIEPGAGTASLSLYKLAHPDLLVELRAAIYAATKEGTEQRKENVRLLVEGQERRVDIQVLALGGAIRGENNLVVLFEPRTASAMPKGRAAAALAASTGVADDAASATAAEATRELLRYQAELERELIDTRASMQSIIEAQEGTNEALSAANEEVQSANEELQSANEELETAKEELQSTNEELATVNDELENRNRELAQTNNDLVNLLSSVELPILILGADLSIRQFTKPAESLLNLIPADIGRRISHIKSNLEIPNLERLVLEVIDQMSPRLLEIEDGREHWYSVRIRPYKTIDNRIDGAILVFIDLDDLKQRERLEHRLAEERRLAAVVRDANDAVMVLDLDGLIRAWNPAAERIYGYAESEALGKNLSAMMLASDHPKLERLLSGVAAGQAQGPVSLTRVCKDGGHLRVSIFASVLVDSAGQPVAAATTERACPE
jgi:two-component system CheB/CheR fusion protein